MRDQFHPQWSLVRGNPWSSSLRACGAYEAFFAELVEMPDAGFSFFISIMPADIQKKFESSGDKSSGRTGPRGFTLGPAPPPDPHPPAPPTRPHPRPGHVPVPPPHPLPPLATYF